MVLFHLPVQVSNQSRSLQDRGIPGELLNFEAVKLVRLITAFLLPDILYWQLSRAGWWFYYMIHKAAADTLQRIHPKLVPKSIAEVDELLKCKICL